ncbi:Protein STRICTOSIDINE SYNTHASE-LIKE 3 [Hibiscus syriacus]|uniref:Protein STRICTOSIDINE SYNTHASE-LIKE 3 n=1 Tax=Hibiscus syriacus TaxID=106335 RepID=A0A6A2YWG8_HIBSY|nr:Protein STRICTOSIDINE SYNTHASE-LIKE 3 [Hibiscus syriacus]
MRWPAVMVTAADGCRPVTGFSPVREARELRELCSFSLRCPGRLLKYWLKGEKAESSEIFAVLPGFPDNVRTNKDGEFWVAIHCRRSTHAHIMGLNPNLRRFILKLPISAYIQYLLQIGGRLHGIVVIYSPEGKLLQVLEDSEGKVVKAISEAEERDGKLWLGSVLMPFVAVYNLA